jgi:RNA polymerase sigma-70 factor (ECF subfamily)
MAEVDWQWLEGLRKGDADAATRLWEEFSAPLRRFLSGILRHPADAEDLTQEALVRFLRHAGEYRGEASLKSYLFQIAHNLALNHLASAPSRRESYSGEIPDSPAVDVRGPVEAAQQAEEAARVREALALLPPQQRAVVLLRAWEDLSFREVAAALGLAEGTAKAHYFFALRNLRKHLETRDDVP